MLNFFKNLYLRNRFFMAFGVIIGVFVGSFIVPILFPVAQVMFTLAIATVIVDLFLLFRHGVWLRCERLLPSVFSLGDENTIRVEITNNYNLSLNMHVIDEIPAQFQKRDFGIDLKLEPYEEGGFKYKLRPLSRGEYIFNDLHIFISSVLGLVERRVTVEAKKAVPVYPSIMQMKQLSLKAFTKISHYQGLKKIRRIGHSYEFEQIKEYVRGDDYRSINWKATGRRGQLMVNQYEDERAQQIYAIIDKSRSMKMPFNGLSLLDYAINASLVIANVALHKHDKAGLLTFSDKLGVVVKAERSPTQLNKILTALYKEKERKNEANFELLYRSSRNLIKGRSLLFLYTNFESMYAADRVLPLLRRINTLHLLVVVFFENSEIVDYSHQDANSTLDIYNKTIAQKFVYEKQQIVQKLRQHGIQAILTRPEELSINSVNKYLELKSRGLI